MLIVHYAYLSSSLVLEALSQEGTLSARIDPQTRSPSESAIVQMVLRHLGSKRK